MKNSSINSKSSASREKTIVKAGIIGICANLFLVIFKMIVGVLSNSIAIILDAVNNLSDVTSSVVTILGAKLAHRAPDEQHPLGHGRYEYISAALVAIIIIYIGVMALIESFGKIIEPVEVGYSIFTVIVVIAAIFIKIFLSHYTKKTGEKVQSDTLIGSGVDAMYDAIISIATLVAIVLYWSTHINVEPYLATIISFFIIKSGLSMLKNTLDLILGHNIDKKMSESMKNEIKSFSDNVIGVYDLIVHDYGPNTKIASVNIEIPEQLSAHEIDELSRAIRRKIYHKFQVSLTSIGIHVINLKDEDANRIRHQILDLVSHYEHVLSIHGFHLDRKNKDVNFDIVIDFEVLDQHAYLTEIKKEVKRLLPDYQINISLDLEY